MKGHRKLGILEAMRRGWRNPQKRRRVLLLAFAICFVAILLSKESGINRQLGFGSSLRQSFDYAAVSTGNAEQCDFYLAESAIPHGGLGVFTTKPLAKGSPAQAWPDICVYITDASKKRGTEVITHTWQTYRFGAQWLGGHKEPRAACMGLVTIFNSMGMREFASARPSAEKDIIQTNGGLDRNRDPGAGAITQYYGATSMTTRDLDAGSELMLWDDGHGGSEYEKDMSKEDGRHQLNIELAPQPKRPPEWLQKHGMCADNIIVKQATDPSMGRGAFARRYLSKSSVIAPAPLQMFPNREKFSARLDGDARKHYEREEAMMFESEQLLVNYAFQPKESSLLLYPYGPGVGLINHANQKSGKINAKLQWSKHHMNHGTQWLDSSLTLDQFWKMQYPGSLILDVVALRNIREGEEIFIDYGIEWERAWEKYVREWKPYQTPNQKYRYEYPFDAMKKHNDPVKPYRTLSEQETTPYAHNILTVCDTKNASANSPGRKEERMKWRPSEHWPENLTACSILTRIYNATTETYSYEVELWPKEELYGKDLTPKVFVDYDVPHSAIRFVDRPFHSDQHIPTAFRHPIGFPEELTPPFWKNEKKQESQVLG